MVPTKFKKRFMNFAPFKIIITIFTFWRFHILITNPSYQYPISIQIIALSPFIDIRECFPYASG
jgi:hypothetical protein